MLRRVPDMKDFDGVFLHAIRHDVRQALMEQFAGAFLGAFAPAIGELLERADSLVEARRPWSAPDAGDVTSGTRECILNPRLRESSSGFSSGLKHPLDAGVHFFFLDEITTDGCVQTFFHSGAETGVFLKEAQRCSLHSMRPVNPSGG